MRSPTAPAVTAPTSVAESLVDDRAILAPDLWTTATEAVLGLLAATVVGAAIAVAMHLWPPVRRALYPLAVGSQAVPMVVLAAPLVIAAWLVAHYGVAYVGLYLALAAAVTFVALLVMKETSRASLDGAEPVNVRRET